MRMLNGLLALLLFTLPLSAQNKVKGIALPDPIEVTSTDLQKRIVPVYDDPSKVLDCKFMVISKSGKQPRYDVTGSGAAKALHLYVPDQGDVYLIFAYALYAGDKPWITDPAQTLIGWGTGTPPPPPVTPPVKPPVDPPVTTPPDPPPTVPTGDVDAVFKSVKNIHFMLVVDMKNMTDDVAKVTQQDTLLKQHFQQPGTNNFFWIYDVKSVQKAVVDKMANTKLPALVIINGGVKPAALIGNPIPLTITSDTNKSIAGLLAAAAGALKK